MKEITDYGKVFETLVQKTQDYLVGNNLSAMVLGVSGGIDSTSDIRKSFWFHDLYDSKSIVFCY